ncbi:unnamed protein product [Cuscuta campestris]|uniref:Reverse transcriptase domain-containing protein n=1 Tax=Cuscuta campestris TaxID=132261 RepID=A0A484K6M0_9ASTE|nr:unnamed protein product [Cuscuta campestris]
MCASLKVINLIFADDLIIACKADMRTVKGIMDSLEIFKKHTGLQINIEKSRIVFGGCNEQLMDDIMKLTSMEKGEMPLTYLGIPISSDCDKLTEKIAAKINMWKSKHISYAGRVNLINTILMGVITFWSRIFILPKKVLKRINDLCRNFLWNATAEYKKSPYVQWENICIPKKIGGLGIRNMYLWNKATIMKLNWDIAKKKDILWV